MSPKKHIIPVFVPHLGCPNDCVFCNQRRISGALTPATRETVINAVEAGEKLIPDGVQRELAFYGGSFTAISSDEQEALLGTAYSFVESGRLDSIRLSTRPDCIDEETLARLKKYGVTTVELGVQSMCEDVLIASNRGHTPQDAINGAGLVKSYGFQLILQMMTGLPGDTPDKSIYTARELVKLTPDGVRIYPTVIIRDTALYDMWQAGEYKEHTVDAAAELCAVLVDIFNKAKIPVIRLGLNPTDELSAGGAVAGAYHPAFGELVAGKQYLAKAEKLLADCSSKNVILGAAKGEISKIVGQKRCNIIKLTSEFSLKSLSVKETNVKKGDLIIL